jgi:hypothetical protein
VGFAQNVSSGEPSHADLSSGPGRNVFSPEDIAAITAAYEEVLLNLGLVNRAAPVAETVARKMVELARRGEGDPKRLRDQILSAFDQCTRNTTAVRGAANRTSNLKVG